MNSLLIYPDEILNHENVTITGLRAKAILTMSPFITLGAKLKASIYGKSRGYLKIVDIQEQQIVGSYEPITTDLKRVPINLNIAIPRPQTIKKLIQLSSTVGINSLRFFKSDLGDPSYVFSKQFRPEMMEAEYTKGLEQAWDYKEPDFLRFKNLADLLEHVVMSNILIADTQSNCSAHGLVPNEPLDIFIGAEKGWSERELSTFYKLPSVKFISLGPRILRVETASALLIGMFLRL